jgi:hypothetical protein
MEIMAHWEAQHIGVIQSVEYVVAWVGFIAVVAILFYKSK